MRSILLSWALFAWSAVCLGAEPPTVREVDPRTAALRVRFMREPSIRDLQQAASRYAGAHPSTVQSWLTRVRRAPWLPVWRAEYQYVSTDDQRLRVGADAAPLRQQDIGTQHRPGVRLQWELDRLVFDPIELRVAAQSAELARLREAVVDRITRVYFERRRLLVKIVFEPEDTPSAQVEQELRLQEMEAALDALSGGVFPAAVWGSDP